jgi:hypothetical protein
MVGATGDVVACMVALVVLLLVAALAAILDI